jgi:hypothetical protein
MYCLAWASESRARTIFKARLAETTLRRLASESRNFVTSADVTASKSRSAFVPRDWTKRMMIVLYRETVAGFLLNLFSSQPLVGPGTCDG